MVTLSPEQADAAERAQRFVAASDRQYFVVYGLAGTGKTTLLAEIARTNPGAKMIAPTGKAAAVLRQKTALRCIFVEVNGKTVCVQNAVFEGVRHGLPPGIEPVTAFDYGYGMTVHKSQGSEWPNVVVVDECHRRDMRAQWLYTALTRASDRILVLRGLR
jgi:ATP-dependent exoDNAse (exonuclease V) alpha subunit